MMKKSVTLLILALVCMLVLSACGCKHETWLDADCVNPKTCADCGKTEGEALGHVWIAANCETPKTCETCGETDGEAKGHAWVDATCEEAKTCESCGLTEGEAPGHAWLDATTEAPKTCETCGLTEGERIVTDPRFTTASTADLYGTWVHEISVTGEMMDIPEFEGTMSARVIMNFSNDGIVTTNLELDFSEEFNELFAAQLTVSLYEELAASGIGQAEADELMLEAYGMTVPEYAAFMLQSMDMTEMMSSIFGAVNVSEVYYVEGSTLYTAMTWTAKFTPTEFTVDGDTLTLMEDVAGEGAESTVFTRVESETP